jgi:prophage regulatory protein
MTGEKGMGEKILRLQDVKRKVGLGKTTIYEAMRQGTFPRPVRLGARAVGWLENSIDAWLAECKPAGTHSE